jgi:hypothetical protein
LLGGLILGQIAECTGDKGRKRTFWFGLNPDPDHSHPTFHRTADHLLHVRHRHIDQHDVHGCSLQLGERACGGAHRRNRFDAEGPEGRCDPEASNLARVADEHLRAFVHMTFRRGSSPLEGYLVHHSRPLEIEAGYRHRTPMPPAMVWRMTR